MVAHTEWSGVNSIGVPVIKNVANPALRAPRPRATALITSIIRMADFSNSSSAASISRRRPRCERTGETEGHATAWIVLAGDATVTFRPTVIADYKRCGGTEYGVLSTEH